MTRYPEATKTVVTTVAEFEQCPPEVLPTLEEIIDSETYRKLTAVDGPPPEPLEFEYLWYQVTVLADGDVIVTP